MTAVFAIDDHAPFLATVALVVEATEGFELIGTADSAESALQSGELVQAELVLVDFRLPGMDGLEFARQLGTRASSAPDFPDDALDRSGAPVVLVMSSYDSGQLPSGRHVWRHVAGFVPKAQLSPAALRDGWATRSRVEAGNSGRGG